MYRAGKNPTAPHIKPGVDDKLKQVFAQIGVPDKQPFTPDPFQLEALAAIERTDCLVTAPTGAGKTTAVAKLATHRNAFGHRKVGLLSLDTFRGGGAEPLHLYAKLSRLPLEVVYAVDDLRRSTRRLRKREVILVDTPGRGPGNQSDTATIHAMLRELSPDEVHMALPAGLNGEYARHLVTVRVSDDPRLDVEAYRRALATCAYRGPVVIDLRQAPHPWLTLDELSQG